MHASLRNVRNPAGPRSRRGATVLFALATIALGITHETLILSDVREQAAAAGYSKRMIGELNTLFPRARSLPSDLTTTQGADLVATADEAKTRLESKVYDAILSGLRARGYEPANVFVAYMGRMRMKVVTAVRTREMPYTKIRETLRDLRQMSEEVLHETFPAMSLAELSTFTILNRRNGKIYEYPVLYQSVRLQPYEEASPEPGPFPRPRAVPLPPLPTKAAVGLESPAPPSPSPGASAEPGAEPSAEPSSAPSAAPSPVPSGQGSLPAPLLHHDGYTVDDFYGDIWVGSKKAPAARPRHKSLFPYASNSEDASDEPPGDSSGSADFDSIDLEPGSQPAPYSSGTGRR